MSLYNMLNGMNAGLAIVASPFLPRRVDHFPRFRNIFTGADDTEIKGDFYVYTRMGGEWDCEEGGKDGCDCYACAVDTIEGDPSCVGSYRDDFDPTYLTFVFRVDDEDRADLDAIVAGEVEKLSDKYKDRLRKMFAGDGPKTDALVAAICGDAQPEST